MTEKGVQLTPDNLDTKHLCCLIRSKKLHPGIEAKRRWLSQWLREGHAFRKRNGCAFIEYAPLETTFVPVMAGGSLYIYCLLVQGRQKDTTMERG